MYPEQYVIPMKAELTNQGFQELRTASEVDEHFKNHSGTSLIVVNSICGCAAGSCRPGVLLALKNSKKKPSQLKTVFAGFDMEATEKVREYALPYPPSSPSVILFKDGEIAHMVERHHIEGRPAELIAQHLVQVFEEFC